MTANQSVIQQVTEPPPVVLYNQTTVVAEEYVGRLSVTEKRVTLHSVRMSDEGSFTVLDREGKIRRRNCLNVRGERRELVSHGRDGKRQRRAFQPRTLSVMSYWS